jgi:hypothetical protein
MGPVRSGSETLYRPFVNLSATEIHNNIVDSKFQSSYNHDTLLAVRCFVALASIRIFYRAALAHLLVLNFSRNIISPCVIPFPLGAPTSDPLVIPPYGEVRLYTYGML